MTEAEIIAAIPSEPLPLSVEQGIVLRLPPWAFPQEPRRLAAGAAA